MIYGIGTDIARIDRFARLLERFGERAARRILAAAEMDAWRTSGRPAAFLAKRFAAKEAFAKALRTGIRGDLSFDSVSVVNDVLGAPSLAFSDAVQALLDARGITRAHLSLSDEHEYVVAFVVLEGDSTTSAA